MNIVLIAIIAMLLLGLLFGAILTVASRVFTVEADPRTEEVYEALPQTNCGACEKKAPNGAIKIENSLPVLDFDTAEGDFSVARNVWPMDFFVKEG